MVDDVAQLVDELRIVGELELPPAVWLQPVRLPDAAHCAGADASSLRIMSAVQCVVSPGGSARVSATTRSAISGPSGAMREGRVLSRSSPRAFSGEALLPAPHTGLGLAGPPHDFDRTGAVGAQQHDLGSPDVLLRAVTVFDQGNQTPMVRRRDGERYSCAHTHDSHAGRQKGIPIRTLMSGRNH